jgi:hypothetical protein
MQCARLNVSLFLLFICGFRTNAQTDIRQIHALSAYIKNITFIEFPDGFGFFDDTAATPGCIYYLYASFNDTIKSVSPGKFFYLQTNREKGLLKKDSLQKAGIHTLLFESPTNTGCWIAECLFQLSPEEAAFMMMHEAMHYTFLRKQYRRKWNISEEAEEAFCDLMANYYLTGCTLIDQKKYRQFCKKNEQIFRIINKAIDKRISHSKAQKRIERKLKHASPFLHQRFNYEVNNAYLLRYAPYSMYYFKLKKKMGIKRRHLPEWNALENRLLQFDELTTNK